MFAFFLYNADSKQSQRDSHTKHFESHIFRPMWLYQNRILKIWAKIHIRIIISNGISIGEINVYCVCMGAYALVFLNSGANWKTVFFSTDGKVRIDYLTN